MGFTDLVVVNGFNDTVSARYSDVSGLRIGRRLPDQIARLIKVNRSDVDAADAERAKGKGEGGAANRRNVAAAVIEWPARLPSSVRTQVQLFGNIAIIDHPDA